TVSITANDASGSEPGTDDGQFTVTLDNGKVAGPGGVTVTYSLTGSTANSGSDYTALSGSVTILEGASSTVIDVDVLDDNIVESSETVKVTLSSAVAANGGGVAVHATNNNATVTI